MKCKKRRLHDFTAHGYAQVRFSTEGGGPPAVVCAASGHAAAEAASTQLRAQMREPRPPVTSTLHTPTGYEAAQQDQAAQVTELPPPAAINASCMRVDGGSSTVGGPGLLFTSRDNGTTWDSGTAVEYREDVAVAFGLRPFVDEVNGTLLLAVAPALVARLRQASAAEQAAVSVTLRLPFATSPEVRSGANVKCIQTPTPLSIFHHRYSIQNITSGVSDYIIYDVLTIY